jgi:antitoxin MazE
MAHLIKIGNSQGIRIPKPIVEQAHLAGIELKLQVVNEGLLVAPSKKPREGWEAQIENILAINAKEPLDNEWLDAKLTANEEWKW